MIAITKERLLKIQQWRETYGPGSNVVLPAEEAEELARIALASLEAEAVTNEIFIPEPATHRNINEICQPGVNQTLFASGWNASRKSGMNSGRIPPIVKGIDAECVGWNACRAAMLQGAEKTEPLHAVKASPLLNSSVKGIELQHADFQAKAAGNSPMIPDGWVLVPVHPTMEMLDEFDSIIDYGAEDSKEAWSRLIAAAPRQEVK